MVRDLNLRKSEVETYERNIIMKISQLLFKNYLKIEKFSTRNKKI